MQPDRSLVQLQHVPLFPPFLGDWSSGMIPASGAGGREFDSRITPESNLLFLNYDDHHNEGITTSLV